MKKLGEPVQQGMFQQKRGNRRGLILIVKMATTMESKMLKIKLKSKSGECIEKELIKTTKIKVTISQTLLWSSVCS